MRIVLRTVAIILIGMGTVWILQGINILPGSFMTGQAQWAYRGGAVLLVGVIILLYGLKRRGRS